MITDNDNVVDIPPTLDVSAPSLSGYTFLQGYGSGSGGSRLIFWRDDFYEWVGTHYDLRDELEIKRQVREFCDTAMTPAGTPFRSNMKRVAEIVEAIRMQTLVPPRFPVGTHVKTGEAGHPLITCRNGRLDLLTGKMHPHDPERLVLNCLPFDYDPTLPAPEVWLDFLTSLWPDDDGAEGGNICLLQEMLGYLVSGRTDLQKMFLLIGPRRAGKGTLAWLIERLLGSENYVGVALGNLVDSFGLESLIGKSIAVIPDLRSMHVANIGRIVEYLLNISGEDSISIHRKYRSDWTGMLPARIVMMTNDEAPRLPDSSGVIASRFVPLKLTQSFYGREDLKLKEKLAPELPQIFAWALEGLRRLTARGCFMVPSSGDEIIEEIEASAAPFKLFFREWLVYEPENPDALVPKDILYVSYDRWCSVNGLKPCNSIEFAKRLRAEYPQITHARIRDENGVRQQFWVGIRRISADEDAYANPVVYDEPNRGEAQFRVIDGGLAFTMSPSSRVN